MSDRQTQAAYPSQDWPQADARTVGFDVGQLERLHCWLNEQAGTRPFRVLLVRHGYLVAEWQKDLTVDERRSLASAAKSVYSSILGIAVAEGKIPSADARVVDYYPEMMDVPEGRGPKAGRNAFPKDRAITFRQLISNTSGYMKPGEEPGRAFNYQTFGMNIITHALGTIYGVYDTATPGERPGFGQLIDRYVKEPIGGSWDYRYTNFQHEPGARVEVFGNYCQIDSSARDMARLGLLWLRWGCWGDRQVLPEGWLRSATRVAPDVLENCSQDTWSYGYAFWTNAYGLLWPALPHDSYAASGAGSQHIWVCPSRDLVVVQGPGIFDKQEDARCNHVLEAAYNAIVEP